MAQYTGPMSTHRLVVFRLLLSCKRVPLNAGCEYEYKNMYRVFQKNLQWFTFLPRIWLMAALSLSVHSATTFGRISCNTSRSAPPPATSLYHLHVQHKSIERFLDMRFLLVFVLMQPRLQFDLNARHNNTAQ